MDKTTIFFAKNSDENIRLDIFLTTKLKDLTRSQIKKIIVSKAVKIDNNIVVMASEKIKNGNRIDVLIQKKRENYIKPKKN
jgi:ribosomal 50S subunit-recycling heat shock protein